MPRGAHAEELTERRDLPRGAEAANLRKVDPDEVDQPFLDERQVFVLRVEQFPIASGTLVCCRRRRK
jgi:hypothetical protein